MDFKRELKRVMTEKGKTVEELCEYLGIVRRSYQSAMQKNSWNLRQLEKIGQFLDKNLFLCYVDPQVSNKLSCTKLSFVTHESPRKKKAEEIKTDTVLAIENKYLKERVAAQEEEIHFLRRQLEK